MVTDILLSEGLRLGASISLALLISLVSIPVIIRVAYKKQLFDIPDGHRKLHRIEVPTFGGVAIFVAVFISFAVSGYADALQGFAYLSGALMILFFTGLKDDLINMSAGKKFIAQVTAATLVIAGSGMYISDLGGVFGIYEISYPVSFLLTLFTILVVINAFNLIDGINGLAGSIGVMASFFFGAGFFVAGEWALFALSAILGAALIGFLRYNFNNASIFMGDTGSIIVGFLLSVIAINYVGLNDVGAFVDVFSTAAPVLCVSFLILPLYDTVRVILLRLLRGDPPTKPGKDHVHHEFLKMGFSHKASCLALSMLTLTIISVTMLFSGLPVNQLLTLIVGLTLLLYPTNGYKRMLGRKIGILLPRERRYRFYQTVQFENSGSSTTAAANGNGNGTNGRHEQYTPEAEEEHESEGIYG